MNLYEIIFDNKISSKKDIIKKLKNKIVVLDVDIPYLNLYDGYAGYVIDLDFDDRYMVVDFSYCLVYYSMVYYIIVRLLFL